MCLDVFYSLHVFVRGLQTRSIGPVTAIDWKHKNKVKLELLSGGTGLSELQTWGSVLLLLSVSYHLNYLATEGTDFC